MGDEDDDLLRAAEELGIDLSGVRATEPAKNGAADEAEEQVVPEGAGGTTGDTSDEYIADPVEPSKLEGNEEILAEAGEPTEDQ